MVVHQDEGVDCDIMFATCLAQDASVVVAILVVDEDDTAVHAPLGYMHRNARKFQTGSSRRAQGGMLDP